MKDIFDTIKYQKNQIEQKLKKLKTATADEILSKNYTKDDFIDTKIKWDMINYSEQENQIIEEYSDYMAKYMNLSVCAYVSHEKLNNLNTFENAEKKNLTKEMTDEQKKILRKISNQVKIDRVLFIGGKITSKIAIFMGIAQLIIDVYWKDLYDMMQPTENYAFICVATVFLILYLTSQHTTENIAKNITKIINAKTR